MLLLQRIERCLRTHRIPPARFGRDAVGDPCFVFDLRDGRQPRSRTVTRVDAYIDSIERALAGQGVRSC